jgi:NAD(P)-dependent dehydrogenase (short-subunit alcohol dehydrogenase family)
VTHSVPLGRIAEAEDIATWVTRLAGPADSLVTGQIVTVDGGMDIAGR